MQITVRIPNQLSETCGGRRELELSAPTIASTLNTLEMQHPALYQSICDETGMVRRHINLFINKALVRDPEEFTAQLAPGDVVTIMTAVSGG